MKDILSDLNEQQKVAVETIEGPVLILAGAGSGKTKALTHRIAYLIREKKISPMNILAVTFTNKAAKEMAGRVAKLLSRNQKSEVGSQTTGYESQKSSKSMSDDPKTQSLRPKTYDLPMMGTFHSICVRILRKEIEVLGYKKSFTIYDSSDSIVVIKKAMKELDIDPKKYSPKAIHSIISSAKNELMGPKKYESYASGYIQEIASEVYFRYQEILKKSQALDFDDLIMKCVELFEKHPDTLENYQRLFKYIHIDEYQDTNHAQYRWAELLAEKYKNIFVIGDDFQCLVPDTKIVTSDGEKKIKDVKRGDIILSASGYGETGNFKVTGSKKKYYDGDILHIRTKGGSEIACTPNHIHFAYLNNEECYYVYLMFSSGKGYRVGTVMGTRFNGKKHDVGLRVRANQERADRMWILKVCKEKNDAIYFENLYSYKYGIPMLVFNSESFSMKLNQKYIDAIYEEIDTKKRASLLMRELGIDFEYPHFIPQATVRNGIKRLNINVVLFGDKRQSSSRSWSASRLSFNTTDFNEIRFFQDLGYAVREGKSGTFRTEIHNLDYGHIEKTLQKAKQSIDLDKININRYSYLTDKKFMFLPASQIHASMYLPVYKNGEIHDDKVVSIEKTSYKGFVYDLNIDKVHNYIASDIVVHNCIYSWRGANFENILNFNKDYSNAKVIKLEQNYRSTKTILDAANSVIEKNENRSKKTLWTEKDFGNRIDVYEAQDEKDEGRYVVMEAEDLKAGGKSLKDIAVLYRTNAQSRPIEEMFLRYNIPYKIVGGVRFYERKEVKDMIAYLRLVESGNDMVAFDRAVNMPGRGIGATSLSRYLEFAKENSLGVLEGITDIDKVEGISSKAREGLKEFQKIIADIRERKENIILKDLLEYAMKRSGYFAYLKNLTDQTAEGMEGEIRKANLEELLSVAYEFSKGRQDYSLSDFLEEIALVSDIDNYAENEEAVTLMTLHSAKGLEFPVVFMVGMEEGIFPHSRTFLEVSEMEEERRLCYVGITRAMEKLYLTYASKRLIYGDFQYYLVSRFIKDIPEELISGEIKNEESLDFDEDIFIKNIFEIGDRVRHMKFGEGTVVGVDGAEIDVEFQELGIKSLSLEYAPIEKI
ncbi:ATP-dependent DNA helicase PcrA [bacterium (Candidatus Howlettbacteria) CG_4_10_14_0_8_um_filter_40_9]|nr:MAG: ATP-dependent DNA helicase PcrA [bacterium (Candidatus Howlettbacteria) CG_4_10_14_0_8_um_filter_40_9]